MTWSEAGFTLGKQLPPDEVDCRHSTYTVFPNLDISINSRLKHTVFVLNDVHIFTRLFAPFASNSVNRAQ